MKGVLYYLRQNIPEYLLLYRLDRTPGLRFHTYTINSHISDLYVEFWSTLSFPFCTSVSRLCLFPNVHGGGVMWCTVNLGLFSVETYEGLNH
jgi:hypothetical protein